MAAAATASSPNSVIATRYELVGQLGQGGMGSVHAAVDRTTGKRVALKLLSPQAAPLLAKLFEREYQTLAGLRHPGIVEVYEYGHDGSAFYTMELLSGGDLSQAAPLPWREVCRCLRDVASILGLLHARKLVHRDLSARNLWRTPDGALKLIDFGALGPFGPCQELAGTPPFVPPEALRMQALDQRADLFALGALGYWLLSGVHAYPAQSLAELERVWEHAPPSFAQLGKLMQRPALAEIPESVEALLRSLLQLDANARPNSTADLIERLHVVADLPRVSEAEAADGHLQSKSFVGRVAEQRAFDEIVRSALQGGPSVLCFEGDRGIGRSRLLEEFAIAARLAGLVPVQARASAGSAPYAFASMLAEGLLQACPEEAREAAQKHIALLARLSPMVRARLGVDPAKLPPLSGELRPKLQAALHAWLREVSQRRPLVLLADDLHHADEESQALLAVLAHGDLRPLGAADTDADAHAVTSEPRLALVASVGREGEGASPALQSFRSVAKRMELVALTSNETLALLRSMFGEAAFLERLAERFHRISDGNPGHCLELVEHLVHSGAAHYADGMWELPRELSAVNLPRSQDEAALRRLERLTPEERAYARLLCVPLHGELRVELCQAAWELDQAAADKVLEALQKKAILARLPNGVRFVHEALRDALSKELDAQAAIAVHLRMADAILQHEAHPKLAALHAAVHCLRAGELERGKQLLGVAAKFFAEHDLELLRATAPLFEEAVTILRSAGADAYTLALPLSILSLAGYYTELRYGALYGDETLRVLSGLLRLDLARKLRRYLGGRFALIVALVLAGFAVSKRREAARGVPQLVRALLGVASTLAGTASCCLDVESAVRCADAVEPLAALGRYHAAGVVHAFATSLAMRSRECVAETAAEARRIVELLESDRPIKDMPAETRARYLAGALSSLGISESWQMGTECLTTADRLEGAGGVYALHADHLRASHYASIGEMDRAAQYRQRVEVHAVALGSAWQVETWTSADGIKSALLTQDVLALKHTAQDLGRLGTQIPSLALHAETAKAAYLSARGKHAEAVLLLDRDLPGRAIIGYGLRCGIFARALSGTGDYARAERICRDAMAAIDPADFDFPLMNIYLPIQYAIAEAGLGKFSEASARLDGLIARHAGACGPLIASSLFEARASVALHAGDLAACETYLTRMEEQVRTTAIQSLKERVEALRRALARAVQPELQGGETLRLDAGHGQLVTRVQLLLRRAGPTLEERSRRAVQVALELTGASAGFLLVQGNDEAAAHLGAEPESEVLAWARQRMRLARENDETAAVTSVDKLIDLNVKSAGALQWCMAPLWTVQNDADVTVGVMALGFEDGTPRLPSGEVLRAMAVHVAHALNELSSVSSWVNHS